MKTEELKQQVHKKFDEKFARINHIHRGECAISDITGTKFQAHTDSNGQVVEVGGLESIKDFIDFLIDKTVQMERERIVNGVKELPCRGEAIFDNGCNDDGLSRSEVLSLITNNGDINK